MAAVILMWRHERQAPIASRIHWSRGVWQVFLSKATNSDSGTLWLLSGGSLLKDANCEAAYIGGPIPQPLGWESEPLAPPHCLSHPHVLFSMRYWINWLFEDNMFFCRLFRTTLLNLCQAGARHYKRETTVCACVCSSVCVYVWSPVCVCVCLEFACVLSNICKPNIFPVAVSCSWSSSCKDNSDSLSKNTHSLSLSLSDLIQDDIQQHTLNNLETFGMHQWS